MGKYNYTILDERFTSKKMLLDRIRNIRESYNDYESLSIYDFEFMLDVLRGHPEYDRKVGSGVASIYVAQNPEYPSRCFWISRTDGSSTDFSFIECLTETSHSKRVTRAFRFAVVPYILDFKIRFFESLRSGTYECPYTGGVVTADNCHIDHKRPNTFQKILGDFIRENAIDTDIVELNDPAEDNNMSDYLINRDLERKWIAYHNSVAELQVVSKEANLSVLRGGLR